mgnify:CR=1 FL=1
MILVKPSFEILEIMGTGYGEKGCSSLELIERAGRTCYKSEDLITPGSASEFVKKISKLNHESVLEHSAMTVRFVCDRGVSHELVRHRLCAFSQESTRYCNYKGGVTFVILPWCSIEEGEINFGSHTPEEYSTNSISSREVWIQSMLLAEERYIRLLTYNWTPQQARSVLPNSLKTEVVVTTNFREWRHIFKLRCSSSAHPQMREIMIPLHKKCKEIIPIIFDDITYQE